MLTTMLTQLEHLGVSRMTGSSMRNRRIQKRSTSDCIVRYNYYAGSAMCLMSQGFVLLAKILMMRF